jgi:serine/threonine protein kinase
MSDLTGQVLANRYRVDAFLGRGGMSAVYKVWDLQRGVPLAMKVLHDDMAQDKVFLRRFKREAQTLATLQHPNIVRFYGLEQQERLAFMLMEFVDGHSLRQEIFDATGALPDARVLQVMQAVCAALNYAHAQGFVHCDVKPANILIDKSGRVLVSDFGISRTTEAATATMVGAGTPAYMSPEQARGENPTPRSDIYALGIVLYEMLTGGERPFTGEHARTTGSTGEKIRWEQLNLAPPSLWGLNPGITTEIEAVVMKCLQKDPERRFAGAQAFFNALSLAATGEVDRTVIDKTVLREPAEQAVPVEPGSPVSHRRRKWGLMVAAGLLLLGVVLLIFSLKSNNQNTRLQVVSAPTATSAPAQKGSNSSGSAAAGMVDDDPSLGPVNAPVIIVEFGDYQCPYCKRWNSEILDKLLETYKDEVRFVFRDFPLTQIHPQAEMLAAAAECADEHGLFWYIHDALFNAPDDVTEQYLISVGASIFPDYTDFANCLVSGATLDEVRQDYEDGLQLGVQSTPTFFINDVSIIGAQPFDTFKQVIDQILSGN